ncbi:hypothetical protein [Brasilonema sp. UFV-L1]|uniref:hypothetical protein n=1 Tax=Brasilonema sp. UFV-L1 TaxID=2234130 RepID=UPI00145F61DC|nr:hypothetical protein [Brasilonema sp. UFV-L1]NMG11819.1 hypothetical protein [Brasilonema sp. UFV-L1]
MSEWKFNQQAQNPIDIVYGTITTGTLWRFLRLQDNTITIDLTEYPLPPVKSILNRLIYMVGL